MDIGQVRRHILEERRRDRAAADERARFARGQDLALDEQLAILDFEARGFQQAPQTRVIAHVEDAGDARARLPGAHHIGRCAPTEQQPQRVHHDGFPATGLARQEVEPRMKADTQPLNDGVILNHQFQQH